MFKLLRFIFWVGVIASLVYFSGDLKYRDRSLRDWALGFVRDYVGEQSSAPDWLKAIAPLLPKGNQEASSKTEVEEVKEIIRDRLTDSDRESLQKLMEDLSAEKAPLPQTAPKTTHEKTDPAESKSAK